MRFVEMDAAAAKLLNGDVYPKPLEIICFHCQQAAEKALKALVRYNKGIIRKTHDLNFITEQLSEWLVIPESVELAAGYLTQYGVASRYPLEIDIDESNVSRALSYMNDIITFVKNELDKHNETEKENEALSENNKKNSNLTNPE
jgi:HEPN domain-containing protein